MLTCQISHFHQSDGDGWGGTYATLNLRFTNHLGDEVFRSKGIYQSTTTEKDDLHVALRQAFNEFRKNYRGFDPSQVPDPSNRFADTERLDFTEESLKDYYKENAGNLDAIEGIWSKTSEPFHKVGIFRVTNRSDQVRSRFCRDHSRNR